MPDSHKYGKRILLIEDQETMYRSLMRWLRDEGYIVRLATSLEEAQTAVRQTHYHIALIDVCLEEKNSENTDGIEALKSIRTLHSKYNLPCIILTANTTADRVLMLFQEYNVAKYIKKEPGYYPKLSVAIDECFTNLVKINFDMGYSGGSDQLLASVAGHVRSSLRTSPPIQLLVHQIRDLFGQLFVDARKLYIKPLKPGMTGAAVVLVQPTWQAGLGNSYVVKIGRLDAIAKEQEQYETQVRRFVPANTVAQLGAKFSRNIGALQYSFATNSNAPMVEFDLFFRDGEPKEIGESLQTLFMETCRPWYELRKRAQMDLPRTYFDNFGLTLKKLISRIQIVLPSFDPRQPTFALSEQETAVLNPVAWLGKHFRECVLPAYRCITHGDLTGRNVMVDANGRCWLIDFFRTGESHILRDFVVLETDIKYRLLALTSTAEFLQFEQLLYQIGFNGEIPKEYVALPDQSKKAFFVIAALRRMAYKMAQSLTNDLAQSRHEYLIALLMTTLNIVRIRGYDEQQKRHAMRSAAIICAELDKLAGRESVAILPPRQPTGNVPPALGNGRLAVERLKASAQLRTLAQQLRDNNLMLFIGSNTPRDVPLPSNLSLAHQLMQEINHQPSQHDSPKKLFTLYLNESGLQRSQLIDRLMGYFQAQPLPSLFANIPAFDWADLFTTNQHTYLEQAYALQKRPFRVIISMADYRQHQGTQTLLYKLHGALNERAHSLPIECLPLTEYDFEWRTIARLDWFWQQMQRKWQNGRSMLMLFATEEEIMTIRHRYNPDDSGGLIWIAGASFARKEQEIYRNLGLRILTESELDLLSTLKMLQT